MASQSFSSVAELFHHRLGSTPDADAMIGRKRTGDGWYTLKWRDVGEQARKVACALHGLGLEKGQRVAILCSTRPEWVTIDMGVLCAGCATTTIYPSNTADECAYIIADSDTRVVFCENEVQVDKILAVREQCPGIERVVVVDGPGKANGFVQSLAEFQQAGAAWDASRPEEYEARARLVGPSDVATLIYTSGTTGPPKGVILTHDNWVYEGEAMDRISILEPSDRQYLFLPLAHSFAKVLEIGFIRLGVPTVVDGDIDRLIDNMGETKPTVMGAVPRVFEKAYNRIVQTAKDAGGIRWRIFQWAIQVGMAASKERQAGREPSGFLALQCRLADALVFQKLKARFGGRMKYFVSGGAPLSRDIAQFFHAAGMLILEGYGLTESSAATCVNRPDKWRFGTVGLPMPGTEVRIAEDGEILMRGRGIMRGYHNRPEDTAAALSPSDDPALPWLHTGDVGVLDEAGFVKITDRKKDIIVTAGGKNIAPQNIEARLKVYSPMISQVVMHGDKRPYCVALVTINEDVVGKWAREQGITWSSYQELAANERVQARVFEDVQAVNRELAGYETIKKVHILDHELSIDSGELTPKLSIKRRVVERNYQHILDGFYAGTLEQVQ